MTIILDDFTFSHNTKPINAPEETIMLSNAIVIQDVKKYTISTLINKVIATVPSNRFQNSFYINNTLFGITKDAIYYFKEEWIKYHVGEILDYCCGSFIFLLLESDLLALHIDHLPPTSEKLTIPILTELRLFKCHPVLPICLMYSENVLHICTKDSFNSIALEDVEDIVIHPNGSKIALIFQDFAVTYTTETFLKGDLTILQKIQLQPFRKIVWLGSFIADLQIDITQESLLRIYNITTFVDIELPHVLAYNATIDGLKLISLHKYHFITPIASELLNVEPSSSHPSQLLIQAYSDWSCRNPTLEFMKLPLDSCITHLLQASLYSSDILLQKKLLSVSRFAIAFTKTSIQLKSTCELLRVLNAIRDHFDPFFTWQQFDILSYSQLFSNLLMANEHYLAYSISIYLKFPLNHQEHILVEWSHFYLNKMKYHPDSDESIAKKILTTINKLYPTTKSFAFAQIADFCLQFKRPNAATELILLDSNPQDQIPLLLKLKQDDLALRLAVQNCQTDLISLALHHLINRLVPFSVIYQMVADKPSALATLKALWPLQWIECCFELQMKQSHIHALLHKLDSISNRATITCNASSRKVDSDCLLSDKQNLQQSSLLAQELGLKLDVKIIDYHLKLVETQEQLENEIWSSTQDTQPRFIGLSLNATIEKCIQTGLQTKALKLKSDFKVPEKRFNWLYIKGLASIRDWHSLEKHSQKKSPIGYKPYVKVCMDHGAYKEAMKYIPKCFILDQLSFYLKIKSYDKASEIAHLQKKGDVLKEIYDKLQQEEVGKLYFDNDDLNDYAKTQLKTQWIQDIERKLFDLGIRIVK